MKNITLIICFLLFFTQLTAQKYHQGIVNFKNKTIKKGFIKLPETSDKEIKFKSTMEGQVEKINSTDLNSLMFLSSNGEQYIIEYLSIRLDNNQKNEEQWLFLSQKGYYNLYSSGTGFSIDKNGTLYLTSEYLTNRTLPGLNYFIKKPEDTNVIFFALTSSSLSMLGLNKILKHSCTEYLSDYPELVEKVMKKELTHRNVSQIISLYNQFKTKK